MAEPRIPFNVVCQDCKHSWVAAYTPMLMQEFCKILKSIRCPNCAAGSKRITPQKSSGGADEPAA